MEEDFTKLQFFAFYSCGRRLIFIIFPFVIDWSVAQSAEQVAVNHLVRGSNPCTPATQSEQDIFLLAFLFLKIHQKASEIGFLRIFLCILSVKTKEMDVNYV